MEQILRWGLLQFCQNLVNGLYHMDWKTSMQCRDRKMWVLAQTTTFTTFVARQHSR